MSAPTECLIAHPTNDPTNPLHRLARDVAARSMQEPIRRDVDYALHHIRALQQEVERLRGSVHVLEATGSTLDDMREHCRSSKTYKLGDTVLCWVNEGDLYSPAVALEARSALTGSAQG